jgi:UrcA family protein
MSKTRLANRLGALALMACATSAAMALSTPSAHAADGVVRIRVGDLDLSRPADVEVARHRVQTAVYDYCAVPTVYPIGYVGQCRRTLMEKAAAQLAAAQALSVSRMAAR